MRHKVFGIGKLGLKCAAFVGGTYGISSYLSKQYPVTKEKSKIIAQVVVIVPCTLVMGTFYAFTILKKRKFNVKRFEKFFSNYFYSSPNDYRFLPLLGSGFAHVGIFHFGFNMFAYNSFIDLYSRNVGPYWSLWFFMTGVVGGSFVSCAFRTLRGIYALSLGASGGVLALAAMTSCIIPDAQYGIIFLPPSFSFDAWKGMGVVTVLSIIGMISKKFIPIIDHAAHLGGILSGVSIVQLIKKKEKKEKKD